MDSANDNESGSSGSPIKLTRLQLRELSRIRTQLQELLQAATQLESDIITSDVQEHLVQTARPSAEMVSRVAQKLRAKGVLK